MEICKYWSAVKYSMDISMSINKYFNQVKFVLFTKDK